MVSSAVVCVVIDGGGGSTGLASFGWSRWRLGPAALMQAAAGRRDADAAGRATGGRGGGDVCESIGRNFMGVDGNPSGVGANGVSPGRSWLMGDRREEPVSWTAKGFDSDRGLRCQRHRRLRPGIYYGKACEEAPLDAPG